MNACVRIAHSLLLSMAALASAAMPAVSNPPARIVSFSPAVTEILFAIGAGPRVIGVTDFCTFPPEARTRTRIGGVINPNFELLLSLKPNLVVLQGAMDSVQRFCKTYHITSHSVNPDSFSGITNTMQELGDRTGLSTNACAARTALAARWNAAVTARSNCAPVAAFVSIWREPDRIASFTTPSANSFINEALRAAGGSTIFNDVIGNYPTVALESVLRRRPRVIFDLASTPRSAPQLASYMRAWDPVRATPAGRAAVIVTITNSCALIPGPRIVELLEEFSRTLRALPQP